MPPRKVTIGVTGDTVRQRIHQIRESQGLSLAALCERMTATGRPGFTPPMISEIIHGGRRVDVDDLVALAAGLRVSPLALLMPDTDGPDDAVETTASVEPVTADRLWRWLRTEYPLAGAPPSARSAEFQWRSKPSWYLPDARQGIDRSPAVFRAIADALETEPAR